jgi:hypothetical protein
MTADMLLDDREKRQNLPHATASAADLADLMEVQAFGRGLAVAIGLSAPIWAAFVLLTLR